MKKVTLKTKVDGILNFMDYKNPFYKIVYVLLLTVLILFALIAVFPVIWVILSSFKDVDEFYSKTFTLFPKTINFSKIGEVWDLLHVGKYYLNSLYVVLGAVVCSVLFNGLLAYAVSILKPKGYKLVYGLVLSTMMMPAVTNMYALLQNIVNLNLIGSYIPIWFAYGANAFYFTLFKTYFDKLPKEVFEAAEIDGCNRLQMFFKLVLPLSIPIMVVVAIFTVNAAWSDFLLPYLVLNAHVDMQTLMVRIFNINENPPAGLTQDKVFMLISLSIIPVIILFVIFQKQITSAQTGTGKD